MKTGFLIPGIEFLSKFLDRASSNLALKIKNLNLRLILSINVTRFVLKILHYCFSDCTTFSTIAQ